MAEKTMEELEAEYQTLLSEKIAELKAEKETKEKAEQEAQAKKAQEELEARIETRIKEKLGIKAESKIEDDDDTKKSNLTQTGTGKKTQFAQFLYKWAKNHGVDTTKNYDSWVTDYCDKLGYDKEAQ